MILFFLFPLLKWLMENYPCKVDEQANEINSSEDKKEEKLEGRDDKNKNNWIEFAAWIES